MLPEVSIVVPVYNAEKYLEQTVESVLGQSFTDYELLLVDDASTDGSHRLMEELAARDGRIRLLSTVVGHGAAQARNEGIRHAQGRYLAYIDADDIWRKDKLYKTLRFMKKQAASFVFTSYEFGDAQARGSGRIVHAPEKLTYRKALSRTVIFTSTVMLDLKKLGKERVYMPDIASEDTASWWKIMRSGVVARGLDENLVIYRRPGGSLSSDKRIAVKRIWALYRRQEGLGILSSFFHLIGWAVRATLRRL